MVPLLLTDLSTPDSVTAGWEHAFGSLLEQGLNAEKGGIAFDPVQAYVHGEEVTGIRPHMLRPNHPKTLELQRRAGVPDSRMKRPVFQIIEEHMLAEPSAIRNITESHGAKKGFTWTLNMKRVPGWEGYLANITTPQPGEADSVTDDSLIVLNTGPHVSLLVVHFQVNLQDSCCCRSGLEAHCICFLLANLSARNTKHSKTCSKTW